MDVPTCSDQVPEESSELRTLAAYRQIAELARAWRTGSHITHSRQIVWALLEVEHGA